MDLSLDVKLDIAIDANLFNALAGGGGGGPSAAALLLNSGDYLLLNSDDFLLVNSGADTNISDLTETNKAAGTEEMYVSQGSSDLKESVEEFATRIPTMCNKFVLDRYYISQWFQKSTQQDQPQIDRLWFMPIRIAQRQPVDEIGVYVTNSGAAGSLLRLGIYTASRNDHRPDSLIVDAGTVDCTSTGLKTISISQTLEPGIVWVVAIANEGTFQCRSAEVPQGSPWGVEDNGNRASNAWISSTFGALPSTFPAGTITYGTAQDVPAVFLRELS